MVTILYLTVLLAALPEELDAKAAYEQARTYFGAEEYELALPYFERAYEASGHRPSTILGLAQCERMLGRTDEALAHYREFLATEPSEAEAARVRETIAMLEQRAALAARRRAQAAEREAPLAPPASSSPPVAEPEATPASPTPSAPPSSPPAAEREVALAPPPPKAVTPPAPGPQVTAVPTAEAVAPDEGGSLFTRPWFWIAVGVAAVGGTALAVGLSGGDDPYGGNTGIVVDPG